MVADAGLLHSAGWVGLAVGMLFMLSVGLAGGILLSRHHGPRQPPRRPEPLPPPPREEVEDPFVHGSRTERREAVRRQGNAVAVLVSDADGNADPHHGLVVDRSLSGLRLVIGQPVEVDAVLSVRPAQEAVLTPWVQVHVKSCRRADVGWEVGCQFIRVPPSSLLWSFG